MKYLASLLIFCALVGLFLASLWSAEKPSVKHLVERLSSDSFEEREEASRQLAEREDAIPQLQAALSSPDAEVRRRARAILEQLELRQAKRGLEKAASLVDSGEVDQAVERLVRWADQDPGGKSLEAVMRFAGKLVEREQKQFGMTKSELFEGSPIGDFTTFVKSHHPLFLNSRQHLICKEDHPMVILRASGVTRRSERGGVIIVSSGDVILSGDCLHSSVIVATGSVILEKGAIGSVIVCDGDVIIKDMPEACVANCIIAARGNVNMASNSHAYFSAIFSGGNVNHAPLNPSRVRCVIRENEPNALGLVKFFDPAKIGIEVTTAKEGVEVKVVGKGSAFASAGVQPGDILTGISGKQVNSPETFRRHLRTVLANGTPFTITARRSEKTLDFTVTVRD
jgi:hypothetical protein